MQRVDQRWWKRRVIQRIRHNHFGLKGVHRLSGISHMAPLSGSDVYQLQVGLPSDFQKADGVDGSALIKIY